ELSLLYRNDEVNDLLFVIHAKRSDKAIHLISLGERLKTPAIQLFLVWQHHRHFESPETWCNRNRQDAIGNQF
ncbi:MAG: hypothetical protein OER74_20735, partial [Desulfobacteraceae bacterium]|nr:hypothetical protein [Desulfobacteraceae bacterium]